ncbi:mechanosensitive ion channel protein MscS [Prosthecochloris sp. ZM_2]|uniref:mechanosensitive ion channel family protein n=1 Tax=Prosthecochloris sp. ZM_2 TaxID=2045206 RepID=UPI000DF84EAA|nr:mechanosensitive ion channel domain-containing protein [Prosthecochloris sp. ZM_2]RNA64617.1 mechanosensitive ion channel protein MscS [Prosthecochloris sp. ZM_2]
MKTILPFLYIAILALAPVLTGYAESAPESQHDTAVTAEPSAETLLETLQEPSQVSDRDVIRSFTDSLRQDNGLPVVVNNFELFRLYGGMDDLSLEERVEKTTSRLNGFLNSRVPVDSLSIADGDTLTAITTPDTILAAFTDSDAKAEDVTRMELAVRALDNISKQTAGFREETSGRNIMLSLLKSIALLLALTVFWHYLNSFFTFLESWIQKLRLQHKTSSDNKLIQLLSPDHLAAGFGWFSRVLELFVKILLIYAYLATVFSFFPWTKDLSANLLTFVLEPGKKLFREFGTTIPNVIAVIIFITIVRYLGRFSDTVFHNIAKGELKFVGFETEWAEPTRKIVKIVLYSILLFLLFASLPLFNNQAAMILVTVFGLTFALSAVPSVKNILSGIMLNYTGSFRNGDRVGIGAVKGEIIHKGLLVTRIKNRQNEIIIIPNRQVFHSKIINYTESVQKNGHLALEVTFYLRRNVKPETIRESVIEAALGTDGIMLDPKPVLTRAGVMQGRYGYRLTANTQDFGRHDALETRLAQNIQDRLLDNNVQ